MQSLAQDRRRRLGPLREALAAAREGRGPWSRALAEMSQVALDSGCPEREAAQLMAAAQVDAEAVGAEALRALVDPIASERELPGSGSASFGWSGGARSQELALAWWELRRLAGRG